MSEMTLLAHWLTPKVDRDAAFDAAVREGTLPPRDRCPCCGQRIAPAVSPAPSAAAGRAPTVDEELAALGSGGAATRTGREVGHAAARSGAFDGPAVGAVPNSLRESG